MNKIANYLITHYKGAYRIKCPYDVSKNTFSRKLDGTYEDIDCYIDCQHGNQIYYYGRNKLQAYIPSIGRGHNILKAIKEQFHGENIIYNIEETDSEIIFLFSTKDADKIIPFLKPKTNGSNISPFSSKNLPKTKYIIPDEDLATYKNIVSNLPQNQFIALVHMTKDFLQSLATKKNTWENIKADMSLKGLKGKEYIHSIGKWDEYVDYLNKELEGK